jgi:hypothetical protein
MKDIEVKSGKLKTVTQKCRISSDRFHQALKVLGIRSPNRITLKYHLEDIELAYEGHLDALNLERQALFENSSS